MPNLSHLKRVLVVEDEALILMDVCDSLADALVAEVIATASAEQALSALDGAAFDAAVLDLHLGRSGWSYDIARRFRTLGIPFIFTSGTAQPIAEFRDVPMVGKPFSTDQLLGTLSALRHRAKMATAE